MKYFAILKDSLREAWDSWVLLVLFILSTLVIGVVALLSFKPLPAARTMQQFIPFGPGSPSPIQMALDEKKLEKKFARGGMHFRGGPSQFRLEKTVLLRGEADAPESDYELTINYQPNQNDKNQMHFEIGPDGQPAKVEKAEKPKKAEDPNAPLKEVEEIFKVPVELGFIKLGTPEFLPQPPGNAHAGIKYIRVTVYGTPLTHRIWATQLGFAWFPLEGTSVPLGYLLYNLTTYVLAIGAWVAVLAGIVITSFFLPNMLRKGTVDLLLVKPIDRWLLLVYKYIGGLAFIFLSTSYAVGGIWLVLGIRSGLWAHGALIMIFSITFVFAVLYAISTLIGVVTRSTITSIILTIGAWFIFYVVGELYTFTSAIALAENEMEKNGIAKPADQRWGDGITFTSIRVVHFISPRTSDLHALNDMVVFTDFMTGNLMNMTTLCTSKVNWWESLAVSAAWIGVFVGLGALWFTYKDY